MHFEKAGDRHELQGANVVGCDGLIAQCNILLRTRFTRHAGRDLERARAEREVAFDPDLADGELGSMEAEG